MIVECPKCATRYQFSPGRLKTSVPTLKCSRCGYVFLLPDAKKQPAPRAKRKPADEAGQEQLALGGDAWKATASAKGGAGDKRFNDEFVLEREDDIGGSGTGKAAVDDDADWVVSGMGESEAQQGADEDALTEEDDGADAAELDGDFDVTTVSDEDATADENDRAAAAGTAPTEFAFPAAVPDYAAVPEPEPDPEAAAAPPRRRPRKVTPPPPPAPRHSGFTASIAFAGVVLVAYGCLAWVLLAQPVLADRVLGTLSAFADLQESALLARRLELSTLDGSYQLIGDRETAFIVSGFATSAAFQPVRDVMIRGRLLGADDLVLAEKEIYCGAATTPAVLGDLNTREITVLQRSQPPPRFAINPGAAASFVIVFIDPPDGVERFAAEVVAASPLAR